MHSHDSKLKRYEKVQNKILLHMFIPKKFSCITQRETVLSDSKECFQGHFNLRENMVYGIHALLLSLLVHICMASSLAIFKSRLK
jgi:hypothetical protein